MPEFKYEIKRKNCTYTITIGNKTYGYWNYGAHIRGDDSYTMDVGADFMPILKMSIRSRIRAHERAIRRRIKVQKMADRRARNVARNQARSEAKAKRRP